MLYIAMVHITKTTIALISVGIAAFVLAGGVTLVQVLVSNAHGQSVSDMEATTQKAQHLTGLLYSVTAITTQCTNQITMGNLGIIQACSDIVASLDKHMTDAFAETETDRNAVMGTLY